MDIYHTARLDIITCNSDLMNVLAHGVSELGFVLEVNIPDSWPVSPEAIPLFHEMYRADTSLSGWLNYFAVCRENLTMIGDCGYLGKPVNGNVEIGYSVIPEYRRKGFAFEMVSFLVYHAFSSGMVSKITAYTLKNNIPSIKVLENLNFILADDHVESDEGIKFRWELIKMS